MGNSLCFYQTGRRGGRGGGSPNPINFLFFSHTIIALLKNYIHALKQELNLYNIYPNYEKKQGPNPSRGGGGGGGGGGVHPLW